MNGCDSLFYGEVVRSYTSDPRYLRRNWLSELIRQRLDQPDIRYVAVIGPPGSGKSSLIAQLAGDYPRSLLYLLRRDQRTPLAEGSAKSFLVRIGLQFSSLYPDVFEPDAIEIEIKQSIDLTGASSEVTGARIARLFASPFYQTIVRVQQEVLSLNGRLSGVEVDELVSDPRLLSVSDLAALALWTPARILMNRHPSDRVTILVDALDEIPRRAHGSRTELGAPAQEIDLVRWLHAQPQLPENVRFVLTSRPGESLDALLQKQASFAECIRLDPDDERVKNDVVIYTHALAAEMRNQRLLIDDAEETRFVDEATQKASGNLGYVGAIARALDRAVARPNHPSALEAMLELAQLPPTLKELYAFFFHQMKAELSKTVVEVEDGDNLTSRFLPSWPAVYKKILAVLSVAYEPLTTDQILDLGRISANRDYVVNAVDNLEQFLSRHASNDRIRLYHPAVAEFLTDTTTRDDPVHADLFVDGKGWHAHISALFHSRFGDNPQTLDDYAIRHRIRHHIAGDGPEQAYEAMTSEWMLFKRRRTGDDASFHADLVQVVESLREKSSPNIVALVRCWLVDAVLLARVAVLPPTVASVWAMCGLSARAESLIALISDGGKRAEAYVQLAHGLQLTGATEKARAALRFAVTTAKTNPYYGDRLATLGNVISAPFVDSDLARLIFDIATMTERAIAAKDDQLSWVHGSLARIYERVAPFLAPTTAAELRSRLDSMLQKPSDSEVRASVLIAAARVSDVLGNAAAAESYAQRAIAACDAPGIGGIKALCAATYDLKRLRDRRWMVEAFSRALARLREGLDEVAEAYAIALLAKAGFKTISGFESSQLDIARAFELARKSRDAGTFQILADVFAAQGDLRKATEAADLCYQNVQAIRGLNQSRLADILSDAVIPAFRASRHHAGLLHLMDVAEKFVSPGYEWERDRLIDIVSAIAADMGFNDVLERAVVVAEGTGNSWERASALSRVGKAFAMTADKQRALSIAHQVQEIVSTGLRRQFPHDRLRGALVLATAQVDSGDEAADMCADCAGDFRYLAVARVLYRRRDSVARDQKGSLTSLVQSLSKLQVAPMPLYVLLKILRADGDIEALAAVQGWVEGTSYGNAKDLIRKLLVLATSTHSPERLQAAQDIVSSFDRMDVIPEEAYAVVDALVSSGLYDDASSVVERLRESARRERPDANQRIAWQAAELLASTRLDSREAAREELISLLDRACYTGMLATARTLADIAPAIAALFGSRSTREMLSAVDEAAAL